MRFSLFAYLGLATFPILAACHGDESGNSLHKTGDKIVSLLARVPSLGLAGQSVKVDCIATYNDSSTKPVMPPDVTIEAMPGMGVSVYGANVTFSQVGTFQVFCRSDQTKMSTPGSITIKANQAASLTTILDHNMVPAGSDVHVTCQAKDSAGNVIDGFDARVEAMPPNGLTIQGMTVSTRLVGQYSIACVSTGMRVDTTPAQLTVMSGNAGSVKVDLSQYTVMAGTPVTVTCIATDGNGNNVDVPTTFTSVPAPASTTQNSLSATQAGDYQVTCSVPSQNLTSMPVTLHVTPALPATLTITGVMPMKTVYKGGDSVTLTAHIEDRYHNTTTANWMVSGAPPTAAIPAGEHAALLVADGTVTLIASVTGMTDMNHMVTGMVQLHVDATPPDVNFTFPTRAQMVVGSPGAPITISGQATDMGSGVQSLMVNNAQVQLDPSGHFTAQMTPAWGVNLITGVAVDGVGNTKNFAQSFMLASNYQQADPNNPIAHRISNGLVVHLGQPVFEDDDPDVDDIATIARLAIENSDLAARIPNPVTTFHSDCSIPFVSITGDLQLHVDSVTFGQPTIRMWAINGGLHAYIEVPNVNVNMHTSGDVCDIGIGISGSTSADRIRVDGDVYVSSGGGQVFVSMPTPSVGIDNLNIHLDLPGVISWAVNGIINLFDGAISSALDNAMAGVIQDKVPPVVHDFLQSINISTGFTLPSPFALTLSVDSGLGTGNFDTNGGTIGLDTTIYTQGTINPEPIGGILQESITPPSFRTDRTLAAAISYDLVNQALYSLWYGGGMNQDLTHLVGNQTGMMGQMVPITARLSGLGPAVLAPTGDPAFPFKLEAGDLKTIVSIHGVQNLPNIDATIYATVSIDANLSIDPSGNIQVALGPNPNVVLEIDTALAGIIDIGQLQTTLSNSIQQLLPLLVSQVIHGIPLPHFDLSQIAGNYLPPGIVLGLVNAELDIQPSHLVLQGIIEQLP